MNCRPELLVEAAGRLARTTTPMLWIYAENDSFFAPAIAVAMYAAYTQNAARRNSSRSAPTAMTGIAFSLVRGARRSGAPARALSRQPAGTIGALGGMPRPPPVVASVPLPLGG
jgi:hypothetical protein